MSEFDEFMLVADFEEPRGFVLGDDQVVRQVFGPPVPPREPKPRLKCPKCDGSGRFFITCAAYFGPDCNRWSCACGASGLVYEIDGTPRDQWPPEPGPAMAPRLEAKCPGSAPGLFSFCP